MIFIHGQVIAREEIASGRGLVNCHLFPSKRLISTASVFGFPPAITTGYFVVLMIFEETIITFFADESFGSTRETISANEWPCNIVSQALVLGEDEPGVIFQHFFVKLTE